MKFANKAVEKAFYAVKFAETTEEFTKAKAAYEAALKAATAKAPVAVAA